MEIFGTGSVLYILLFGLSVCYSQSSSLNFFVVGDWGRGTEIYNETQKAVARAMSNLAMMYEPQFLISVGDNFYEDGVTSVNDTKWNTDFSDVYNHTTLDVPWYVVLGNHDYMGNITAEQDYQGDRRWRLPGLSYTERFQVDESSFVTFVFIDTTPFIQWYYSHPTNPQMAANLAKQNWKAQQQWIDNVMKYAPEDDWLIAVGHHYLEASEGQDGDIINNLFPLFSKYGVSAYISGHAHNQQYLMYEELAQFVSGAGSYIDPPGPVIVPPLFQSNEPGFLAIQMYTGTLVATMYNSQEAVIFETTVDNLRPGGNKVVV